MRHSYGLQNVFLKDAWLTIGSFDGVHLGHQQIIKQITAGAQAEGLPAVVVTFYPHPSVVLRGKRDSFYLTLPEEKAAILNNMGVDLVVTHPFDLQVASMRSKDFIETLHQHLNFSKVTVGYDFSFGRNREGNVKSLNKMGEEMGFTVKAIDAFELEGEVVSSSRIRSKLEGGEINAANRLLGRNFGIGGKVIPGDGRGKQIGVPTANIEVAQERAIPAAGVYACRVIWSGEIYPAVTNIGVRPTFESEPVQPRVETHILDFSADMYNQNLELEFIAHLRDERRFESIDALVSQIHQDIATARALLSKANELFAF